MEKTITINATLLDANRKRPFYVNIDTIANRIDVYQLSDELIDPKKDIDKQLRDLFGTAPSYHMEVYAELLSRLVDQLGGIEVKGKKLNGTQAMESARKEGLDDIIDGILKALRSKNLLLTLPGLLSSLSENYKTDLPLMDVIKTALSEVGELGEWKIYRKKIKDRSQIK